MYRQFLVFLKQGMEVSVKQVFDKENHLRTIGARNQIVRLYSKTLKKNSFLENCKSNFQTDHVAARLAEEWHLVKELMERRSAVLHNAKEFFTSAQRYFAEVPRWTAQPGVNPNDVLFNQESLEEAIRKHDAFWAQVEEVYAQAYDDASKVTRALKEADAEDNVAREHSSRLQRAHKQLMEKWKERQVGIKIRDGLKKVILNKKLKLVKEPNF